MANNRLQLQSKLEELLGSRQVYYQSPENIKMEYPAIVYSRGIPESRFANNKRYFSKDCYELIVISKKPDPEVVEKILKLTYTSPARPYVSDNLNHYPITIYY